MHLLLLHYIANVIIFVITVFYFLLINLDFWLAYTPGWNDPPSYSFEDSVNAQQENRPKIFDRIPARVFPNSQIPQSNLENPQIPLDSNTGFDENYDDGELKNSTIPSSNLCDIPVEERLLYVMTSLNDSIQKSALPEVNYSFMISILIFHLIQCNMYNTDIL